MHIEYVINAFPYIKKEEEQKHFCLKLELLNKKMAL
jgi:hypothetical protein